MYSKLVHVFQEKIKHLKLPDFPKLKELMLKVGAWYDDSLLNFTPLIEACPFLLRFAMQVHHLDLYFACEYWDEV